MPQVKLTKSAIDALPTPSHDLVYWDLGCPGFGVKVTPKGRKVFVVMYRTAGSGSRLRKYTIGPYGRVTLNQARVAAQKVFAAKLEGRDLAAEKAASRRRIVADRVEDLLEAFIAQHVSQNRSAREISRMLRREVGAVWGSRSIHEISKRDVIAIVNSIEQRGAPIAANKMLKTIKTFFRWCVGRALLDRSPADGVPLPAKQVARDRVLSDDELVRVILAARQLGGPYGNIVEMLALTGQRREEVARCTWDEINLTTRTWRLPSERTKNGKAHEIYLSDQAVAVLARATTGTKFVFSKTGAFAFQGFGPAKDEIDKLSDVTGWRLHDLRRTCVSGMARLGVAPHVADKILNHQTGTISGVAAVYQRHDFLAERKAALELWGAHVATIIDDARLVSARDRRAA
ncbi:integrase [Afipia carboxidovorans OM5]|uniref:Integrase n=1 Tax=Afipia carboxidovorans (strain ATCC 49405 / DSM 1227 / KCTC 32145 / OM5) TaxID=504832 RepID=F8BXZ1_AFIC5|nr:site-specific integrase [Afipia carboxidovorans]AEI01836.1 integrase [Afipia carboxidovorans OM4]AEI05411.1 integrase [Afipia carboxidovorans OM5]